MDKEALKEDFSWVREDDRVLAVLLFWSFVEGEDHAKSDIDLTLVVSGGSHF